MSYNNHHYHLHSMSLNSLTNWQCSLIKDHIIDIDNRFNKVFSSFNPLNPEFCPGNRIVDNFSHCFYFHSFSKSSDHFFNLHTQQLDAIAIKSSSLETNALIIIDASVKNSVAISISHIHVHNKPVVKTLYYTVNIMSTEAEFFALCYGINQAISSHKISKIIVITDSFHVAKKIFNPLSHPLQKYFALILNNLREFFSYYPKNIIKFWECPSKSNWHLYKAVNMDTKSFCLTPLLPNKYLWDFSKKLESDNIINKWKMTFQASDLKGRSFLDLVDSDDNILEPLYCKRGT